MASECLEGGDDDDIECIDFVYPITLFTFGVDNQQANEVQVMSDQELRRFFDELEDDDLISIEFPITLKKYDGTEVTVQNNAELAAALEMAKTNVMRTMTMITMMMILQKDSWMSFSCLSASG